MMRACFLFIISSSLYINPILSQGVQAYFSSAMFQHPEKKMYLETYLAINGNSIQYKPNEKGNLQGIVEITLIFSEGDSIRYYDKYDLKSPELSKQNPEKTNFLDLQRIPLRNGIYTLELQIIDKNTDKTSKPQTYKDVYAVNFSSDSVIVSDIELVESYSPSETKSKFTKGGMDVIPYSSNYFPQEVSAFIFYLEIYNTPAALGENQPYLVNFFFESPDGLLPLEQYKRFRKQTSTPVNVLLSQFDIKELPSGNYNFVVEVRDRNNLLLSEKKLFFQRSNPNLPPKADETIGNVNISNSFANKIPSLDSLMEAIRSLAPISNTAEKNYADTQLKVKNPEMMKKYFTHFWERRDRLEPENAWIAYNGEVKKVQDEYGTSISKGYETDRGRVYLQYGQPNSVSVSHHEPSSYPYEVWHYYRLEGRSNVKFVFYNPDLVTNDYELLHSDLPGEPYDRAWNYKLQKRDTPLRNIDVLTAPGNYGNKSSDFFLNPR